MSRTLRDTLLGIRQVPDYLPAIRYGKEHEKDAIAKVVLTLSLEHSNLHSAPVGCYISKKVPCLAATPDAV